jgi:hypothetical protein
MSEKENQAVEIFEGKLDSYFKNKKRDRYISFTMAALGSVPWVGSVINSAAAIRSEIKQGKTNELHIQWLKEHQIKIEKLILTLSEIFSRLDSLGDEIKDRIESTEYLTLVRKSFRIWDEADTDEKRNYIRKLITNAAATKLSDDDLIRLFIDWIDTYHEAHFKVIREIYKNRGITRGRIWDNISGTRPKEDSAEADVYKLLIRDLSMGSVIRQHRETDAYGQFVKRSQAGKSRSKSSVMKSAFDDTEPYELTELGSHFVHYTMSETVTRLDGDK